MDPHLRVFLLCLSCLASVGCKKHPKPAPDPSVEELRVALLRAAFATISQLPESKEATRPVTGEGPSSDRNKSPSEQPTASAENDGNLASWSRYVDALASNLPQPGPGTGPDAMQPFGDAQRRDASNVASAVPSERPSQDDVPISVPAQPLTTLVPHTNSGQDAVTNDIASTQSEPPSSSVRNSAAADSARDANAAVPPQDSARDANAAVPPQDTTQVEPAKEEGTEAQLKPAKPEIVAAAKEPAPDVTALAEQAAISSKQAALYGAGPGFTGNSAGKIGATGIGAGLSSTGIGAGTGHTGTSAGPGTTGIGAGVGFTGIGAGTGFTGLGAGSGFTGIGAGSGSTGLGAGWGFTGIGAGSGFTGIGASSRPSLDMSGADPGAGRRGYVFMLTPWGPLLVAVAAQN